MVETGLVPVNKWSGMIPATDVFEMPFFFKDLTSIKKFLDAGAGDLLDREFQKKAVKTLFWVDYGYIQFFNNKRPLTKPDDFKGLKMRTFSSGDAETLRALGAAPTVMSSSEMYMALQRGTVDGATTGMPAAVSRKVFRGPEVYDGGQLHDRAVRRAGEPQVVGEVAPRTSGMSSLKRGRTRRNGFAG